MASLRITAALVSLAISAHAWPHIRSGSRLSGEPIRDEDIASVVSSRRLPGVDESFSPRTLPVQRPPRQDAVQDQLAAEDDYSSQTRLSRREVRGDLPVGDISPGSLTLPIVHIERPSLDRRGVEIQLKNRSDLAYYAQLNIGNPAQKVFAQLDTGSFELWVNPDCRNLSQPDISFCRATGNYNPSQSSSAKVSNRTTQLTYGIGSADVTYVLDDVALANAPPLKQIQFGVAQSSQDQFSGILGLGHGVGINTEYKNFVDQLADQGITKTKAYSVALGSKADKAGVVVFGGIDTGKFAGKLAPLPLIPGDQSPDGVARFWVNLSSMTHTSATGGNTTLSSGIMPVFLDTGATLTLLPPRLADKAARAVGAAKLDQNGFYMVDCGLAAKKGSLDFHFDGVTIRVPYREFVHEIATSPRSCYLGIMPSTSFTLLGDTFLRSAYVVFDISGNMTYMAPYANCGSRIQTMDASTDVAAIEGTCSTQSQVKNGTSKPVTNSPGVSSGNKTEDSGAGSVHVGWSLIGILAASALAL